jgi:hypothetical protein
MITLSSVALFREGCDHFAALTHPNDFFAGFVPAFFDPMRFSHRVEAKTHARH